MLADRVVVSTSLDPFLSLRALAEYSGLSRRKLRDYLADPAHPLPCYRIGGKLLVRRSEYDAWAVRYRQVGEVDVDRVVTVALLDLGHAAKPPGKVGSGLTASRYFDTVQPCPNAAPRAVKE
jgi:hypothetical protein